MQVFYTTLFLQLIFVTAFDSVFQVDSIQRSGWRKFSKARNDTQLLVKVALMQQNIHKAEEQLLRVSNPLSAHFGKHWTRSRVESWFSPHSSSVAEVTSWLQQSGIHPSRMKRSSSGGWLLFGSSIAEAERIFRTTYHLHKRGVDERDRISYDRYVVPTTLAEHVDFISSAALLDHQPKAVQPWNRSSAVSLKFGRELSIDMVAASSCDKLITPNCLRSLYRLPRLDKINPHPASTFGNFEITVASWLPDDLDLFFRQFAPSLVGMRPKIETINGGSHQTEVQGFPINGEADLDFEYTIGLTGRPGVNLQVGNRPLEGIMDSMLAALDGSYCDALNIKVDKTNSSTSTYRDQYNRTVDCGTVSSIPAVIAIPYSWDENEFSKASMKRQCLEFLKLGLQGVTVIVASGDSGTAGWNGTCQDNGRFNPSSPAVCPYVTSVGGTQLQIDNATQAFEEVALLRRSNTSVLSSGGGFSSYFEAPSYQLNFTTKYLRDQSYTLGNQSLPFNSLGRGIPDIAANGKNYVIALNNKLMTIHGTSASVPTIASLVTLLNDARLRAGKSTVGFMNPVLYANPNALKDITSGENYACPDKAFQASEGWDPVTGLGAPDFEKLSNIYSQLP